jgi:Fe-S-cluster-containing hydrogenase component 2
MCKGIALTGTPSIEELESSPGFPSRKRLLTGPVAVIECVQEIPCDVCGSVCPYNAINVPSLKSLPQLDENKCVGCGACIPFCPGLAIFLVDSTYSREETLVSFPYELQPLPELDAVVEATDRLGRGVTAGRVVKVLERDGFDGTVVLTIAIPAEFAQQVRGINVRGGG